MQWWIGRGSQQHWEQLAHAADPGQQLARGTRAGRVMSGFWASHPAAGTEGARDLVPLHAHRLYATAWIRDSTSCRCEISRICEKRAHQTREIRKGMRISKAESHTHHCRGPVAASGRGSVCRRIWKSFGFFSSGWSLFFPSRRGVNGPGQERGFIHCQVRLTALVQCTCGQELG
jgi:hypothetical protein